MKSKAILPEEERDIYDIREDENLETVAYTNGDIKILMEALKSAEQQIQEDKQDFLVTIQKREDEIHKHISRVQELEKFIKECKALSKSNAPEVIRKVKQYKV